MNKDRIREILLKNGFTLKDGHDDLKSYVYAAIEEILYEARFLSVDIPPLEERGSNNYVNGFAHGAGAMRVALGNLAEELAVARISGPQTMCVCGSPKSPGVFHRTDGPCRVIEPDMERVAAPPVSEDAVRRKMQYTEGEQDGNA